MSKTLQVQRHELKYYLSRSDYEYCKFILSNLMEEDENQNHEKGYFIRSLYFDDIADSSVEEKLEGTELRDKYRIRIYDCQSDWAKLERKRKNNQYVNKSSLLISKKEVYQLIEGDCDFLLQKSDATARTLYFDFKQKYLRPVVVVDYHRDVYKLDYNEIRITFDKRLRNNTENFDIFDPNLITNPLQREEVVEMEVKFNHCLPSWFKDLLHFESATSLAISKYCQGRMNTREYYQN